CGGEPASAAHGENHQQECEKSSEIDKGSDQAKNDAAPFGSVREEKRHRERRRDQGQPRKDGTDLLHPEPDGKQPEANQDAATDHQSFGFFVGSQRNASESVEQQKEVS